MNYSITTLGKKTIAGFHLVGPWDHTFEVYLNDGNHDGYWDIDMYVPVERVAS